MAPFESIAPPDSISERRILQLLEDPRTPGLDHSADEALRRVNLLTHGNIRIVQPVHDKLDEPVLRALVVRHHVM